MTESDFKAMLRRRIRQFAYIQSMSSYATNGTPDLWISGPKNDLWLEVKVATKYIGSKPLKAALSPLQRVWLDGRHAEGRNCAVITGITNERAILLLDGAWTMPSGNIVPLADAIEKIKVIVCGASTTK